MSIEIRRRGGNVAELCARVAVVFAKHLTKPDGAVHQREGVSKAADGVPALADAVLERHLWGRGGGFVATSGVAAGEAIMEYLCQHEGAEFNDGGGDFGVADL